MTHIEKHEEIILNHIGGSLDDDNLNEALGLLRQCKECREIYENSLTLRSEFHRTSLLNYRSTKPATMEAPARRPGKAWPWRPLLAIALLGLAVALPLGMYAYKLGKVLREHERARQADQERIVPELAALRQDNKKLEERLKEFEGAQRSTEALKESLAYKGEARRSTVAEARRASGSFWNPHTVAVTLSGIRDQEAPAKSVMEIELPKRADLLHLALSVTEEGEYPRYRVVIADGENKAALERYEDIKKDRFGNLNLYFPRNFFTRRDYWIKIFGLKDGRSQLIAQQRIRLSI